MLIRSEIKRNLRHVHGLSRGHFDSFAFEQRNFREFLRKERFQLQSKMFDPLQRNRVCIRNAAGASFRIEIVRESFTNGMHAAAGMELCFKNDNLVSRPI